MQNSHQYINRGQLPPHLIVFDGVCNLCNGAVQFVIRRDRKAKFMFTSLQSEAGQEILRANGMPSAHFDSFIYIRHQRLYQRSTAALYMLRDLGGLWALLFGFIIVPRVIRDAVYDMVARNRYRWFGRRESCMVPTAELQAKFLS